MGKESKKSLEAKWWYRLLKVAYVGTFLFFFGIYILVASEFDDSDWFIGLLMLIGFFWIIKKAFYYVALGKDED